MGKVVAKAASFRIDNACNAFLHDCFKQFGIHVVALEGEPEVAFNRQKFEACILRLYDPDAEKVLTAARNSSSNRRIVIYGIARNTKEALQFSNLGINAIIDEPLDRQRVLKMVRATHLLVIHELRRYVRVPVVTEAVVEAAARKFSSMTVEVSAGGLSVFSEVPLADLEQVRVSFTLPNLPRISVRAHACWRRASEKLYGLRFDTTDDARLHVRKWIDQYLDIM